MENHQKIPNSLGLHGDIFVFWFQGVKQGLGFRLSQANFENKTFSTCSGTSEH